MSPLVPLGALLALEPRLPGRARYLDAGVPPGRFASMAAKYGALLDALLQPEPLRSRLLGRIARRHTGALREAQLVPPVVLLRRYRQAEIAARHPARSRAAHLSAPTAAVVLWHDLHELLGAQLAARRRRRTASAPGPVPGALRPAHAYERLAAATGLSRRRLEALLCR